MSDGHKKETLWYRYRQTLQDLFNAKDKIKELKQTIHKREERIVELKQKVRELHKNFLGKTKKVVVPIYTDGCISSRKIESGRTEQSQLFCDFVKDLNGWNDQEQIEEILEEEQCALGSEEIDEFELGLICDEEYYVGTVG